MSKFSMAIAAFVIVCAVPVVADDAAVRREIQNVYDRASAASIAARTLADLDAIHQWLDTPDCVYADTGQPRRTWGEMRAYAAEGLRTRLKSLSSRIITIDVQGTTVIAATLVVGVAPVADAEGRFGPKGAIHDVETTATVRDIWVKTGDGWRRKSHDKIVPNRLTSVDGKALSK